MKQLDEFAVIVDFAVTQKDDGAGVVLYDEGLIGGEGVVDDGETMESDENVGVGFEGGVVGAAMREELKGGIPSRFVFFGGLNECPNAAHIE